MTRSGPNRFDAKSTGVVKWRLLLERELIDVSKPVTVQWNGRTVTRPVTPSKAVLLRDFAERFDRTRLPVVEVSLP